jgi:ABC-type multidrug transport system permease subunit
MRRPRAQAAAFAAMFERDLRVFLSYRLRAVTLLLAPATTVTVFYYISRLARIDGAGGDAYFAYVVVGIAGLDVLTSTVGLPPTMLRQEMVAGTFERLVVSPFGALRGIVGLMLFPLTQALIVAGATVAFAAAFFGLRLSWPEVVLSPLAAVLGGVAFAPLGILALAALLVAKQTLSAVGVVITGLSIVAGVYFPARLLPDWVEWMSHVQPLTPALDLLRHLVTGAPSDIAPWTAVGRLAAFTAVLLPVSLWSLQRSLRHSRRRGTIIEY